MNKQNEVVDGTTIMEVHIFNHLGKLIILDGKYLPFFSGNTQKLNVKCYTKPNSIYGSKFRMMKTNERSWDLSEN